MKKTKIIINYMLNITIVTLSLQGASMAQTIKKESDHNECNISSDGSQSLTTCKQDKFGTHQRKYREVRNNNRFEAAKLDATVKQIYINRGRSIVHGGTSDAISPSQSLVRVERYIKTIFQSNRPENNSTLNFEDVDFYRKESQVSKRNQNRVRSAR